MLRFLHKNKKVNMVGGSRVLLYEAKVIRLVDSDVLCIGLKISYSHALRLPWQRGKVRPGEKTQLLVLKTKVSKLRPRPGREQGAVQNCRKAQLEPSTCRSGSF